MWSTKRHVAPGDLLIVWLVRPALSLFGNFLSSLHPRPATWSTPSSSLPATRSTADTATIPTRTSLASPTAQRSPLAPAEVSSISSVLPQNYGPSHYLTEHRSSISPTLRLSHRGFTSDRAAS